ncbi:MAG: trans-sulfuration enzyme family protein [Brevinema sp.]
MKIIASPYWEEDVQICLHEFEQPSDYYGAINPPVIMTSLFAYPTYDDLLKAMKDEHHNCVYSRGTNPTTRFLEYKMAALERGESAKCFSSGMGAITAALFTLLQTGDHVLVVNNIYGPVLQYLTYAKKNNISFTHITGDCSLEIIKQHIKPETKLIYFESPATMTFKTLNIKELCDFAKSKNILTMCDNTYSTPLFQKPILAGCDIVAHSLTKYIGGHSDLVAGCLVTSHKIMDEIFYKGYLWQGSVMSPLSAMLGIRGLRTLPLRIKAHESNAIAVAEFLKTHPRVLAVNHPIYIENKVSYDEIYGTTGLFSFELDTENLEKISLVLNKLQTFQKGVSWGGFESLAISPHFGSYDPIKNKGVPLGLVRLSIGLEDTNTLIKDLDQAFTYL